MNLIFLRWSEYKYGKSHHIKTICGVFSGDGHLNEKLNLHCGHLSEKINLHCEHLSEKINLHFGHLSEKINLHCGHLSDTEQSVNIRATQFQLSDSHNIYLHSHVEYNMTHNMS